MNASRVFTGLALVLLMAFAIIAAPQKGQIVVDPNNPARMVYHDTYITVNGKQILKPCVFAGPGDPEDFFHNNTSNNLNLLKSKGARCTYITAWLKDFGGGNPPSDLSSWDAKITELQNAGIITVFFLFDDSQKLPSGWQTAVGKMVDTFKKHKLFIWSVAEEYGEALSKSQVSEVAKFIADRDDNDHVIGVHQNSSTSFGFNSDPNLGMFLMQYNAGDAAKLHNGCISAWNNMSGKKILNMAEAADHGKKDRTTVRKWNWASVMGGASAVQVLSMGRASDPSSWNEQGKYDDCAELTDFMQKTDINTMVPNDGLAAGSTKWVLAKKGVSYIAYTDNLSGTMGVKDMSAGAHSLTWLDIGSGKTQTTTETATAGENTFSAPSGFDGEVAVWIAGGGTSDPPKLTSATISPQSAEIIKNGTQEFIATGKDQYGQNISTTFSWTVSGGGTIAGGTFTSNGTEGTFTITATSKDNSAVKATATLKVVAEMPAPVAKDQSAQTTINKAVGVSLAYESSSDGPFEFTITQQPSNGTVANVGNDATYTPKKDFAGTDSYKWTVTDKPTGKVSNEATVTISVESGATAFHTTDNFSSKSKTFSVVIHGNVAEISISASRQHTIELLSIHGRCIALRANPGSQTYQIPLSTHGAYLLRISTADGTETSRIFMAGK